MKKSLTRKARISYNLNIRGFGKGKSFCMRKFIVSVVVALVVLFGMGAYIYKTNKIIENYENQEPKITNKGLLSMMLETESGSGKYQETTANEWPTDGYVFNETKSGCENGGTLSWDDENKNVIMEDNGADKCYVYFNKKFKLYEYVKSLYTGTQGENYLYFHNGTIKGDDGTVLDANDNSYRYSGGDFQLTEKVTISGLTTLDSSSNTTTNGVINFYCNGTRQYVGYSCDSSYTSYYTLQYDVTFTQYPSYVAAMRKAMYDGYVTETIKNFVCFGYDSLDGTCPTDNLYRIIGVFENQVKLIKYDYAKTILLGTDGDYYNTFSGNSGTYKGINAPSEIGAYYWNKTGSNVWGASKLNTVNLNTNYLNNIGTIWSNKIATHTWKVGGNTWENMLSVGTSMTYKNEIISPAENTIYDAKVGLMYASDYGFAVTPSAWTTLLENYTSENNWMYMGLDEWMITRRADRSDSIFIVSTDGSLSGGGLYYYSVEHAGVRPVLFLDTSVIYENGNGSMEKPYIIS